MKWDSNAEVGAEFCECTETQPGLFIYAKASLVKGRIVNGITISGVICASLMALLYPFFYANLTNWSTK